MTVKDLQSLYDYGYWANARLFEILSQLSNEEFTKPVAGSYGSVRNTLVDAMSAEWGWLDRCGGAKRGPALVAADYPTPASLIARWRNVEASVRLFLGGLKDEDLDRTIAFALGEGPTQLQRLGELMHHGAIHGVHHRGQAALLLRVLGYAPSNFDILFYYGANSR